jgi:segregation and condensation protein B
MEIDKLRRIVEGALMAADSPLSVDHLQHLFGLEDAQPTRDEIRATLEDIETDCADRGYELKRVASGYRFQVREDLSPWIARLWDEKPQRYSRALLETLAIIAYRQPITRGDIENIRGVAVNSAIVKTLLEREWIRVVGHRDVPGKPALYATTRLFLDYFNLQRLEDLPPLSEIRDLVDINPELALNDKEENAGGDEAEAADEQETSPEVQETAESEDADELEEDFAEFTDPDQQVH